VTTVVHCKRAEYDVYIGRPSKWGNPYSEGTSRYAKFRVASREEAIRKYEEYIRSRPDLMLAAKRYLKGKVLGCWCSPLPCHGDVLARIAEEPL
jgi:hypothetical protein